MFIGSANISLQPHLHFHLATKFSDPMNNWTFFFTRGFPFLWTSNLVSVSTWLLSLFLVLKKMIWGNHNEETSWFCNLFETFVFKFLYLTLPSNQTKCRMYWNEIEDAISLISMRSITSTDISIVTFVLFSLSGGGGND